MAELTSKTIDQLIAGGYLSGTELFVISSGGYARKLSFNSLKDNLLLVHYADDQSDRASAISDTAGGYAQVVPGSNAIDPATNEAIPNGAQIFAVSVIEWATSAGHLQSVVPYHAYNDKRAYVTCDANTVFTKLKLRWWYTI